MLLEVCHLVQNKLLDYIQELKRRRERKEFIATEGGDSLGLWMEVIQRAIGRQDPKIGSRVSAHSLEGSFVKGSEEKKEINEGGTGGEEAKDEKQAEGTRRGLPIVDQGKFLSYHRRRTRACGLGPLKSRRKITRTEKVQLIKSLPIGTGMKRVVNPYSSLYRVPFTYDSAREGSEFTFGQGNHRKS